MSKPSQRPVTPPVGLEDHQPTVELDPALTAQPTAVATRPAPQSSALATHDDLGTGFEDFTQEDLSVPFIRVLQSKSPEVEEGSPKQIPGAKAGSFFNTVTGEVYDGKLGIRVIPVHRLHNFLEWIPRDDGGGLNAVYEANDPRVLQTRANAGRKFGKLKTDGKVFGNADGKDHDNNDLVESFNVFALLLAPDGTAKRVVIGFSSSQIGTYKKWMTMAMEQTKVDEATGRRSPYPLWSHRYRLTTAFNQNKKGTWFKMDVRFDGTDAASALLADDDPTSEEAKQFRALLLSGAASANFSSVEQDAEVEDDNKFEM